MNVKEAVAAVSTYLSELYSSDELSNLRLEEVWLSEDEKYWLVTMSFTRNITSASTALGSLEALTGPKLERVFKTIKIDATTGDFVSMTIRQNVSPSLPQIG